jgi:hypothetical protein
MAESKKATKKTGVTHFALEAESENQQRVPPRGMAKKQVKTASPGKTRRTKASILTAAEERAISRQGAKGGKSGGSRAGLVSSSKKTRRA